MLTTEKGELENPWKARMALPDPLPVRPDPPLFADERTSLRGWLDLHHGTLAMLYEGLSDEDLDALLGPAH